MRLSYSAAITMYTSRLVKDNYEEIWCLVKFDAGMMFYSPC